MKLINVIRTAVAGLFSGLSTMRQRNKILLWTRTLKIIQDLYIFIFLVTSAITHVRLCCLLYCNKRATPMLYPAKILVLQEQNNS